MDIFFCDISGTFTGSKETRKKDLNRFTTNLTKLVEKDNTNELLLCFISSNNPEDIQKNITELEKHLKDPRIALGYHYSENKKFKSNQPPVDGKNGKTSQIFDIIKTLNKKLDTIYFADDVTLYHEIIDYVYSKQSSIANKMVHYIPGVSETNLKINNTYIDKSKNINGLNSCIEQSLKINDYVIPKIKKK